jgi:hypothetical protein
MAVRDEGATGRNLLLLFALWLVVFGGGYLAAFLTEPTDFGFTRGLNRILIWFWSQAAALVVALIAWFTSRGTSSRLGRAPLAITVLEVLGIAGYIAYAMATGT